MAELFGSHLRRLRLRAGWTQAETGRRVHVVGSRIAQLEGGTGHRPTLALTRALDAVLDADGLLVELLPHVWREAFPDWSRRFMELSHRATGIRQYLAHEVPGLLQTEDYARAVLGVGCTLRDPAHLEERVAARMTRQQRLDGPDRPEYEVVLDESVLLRHVGEAEVMRSQLQHLLRSAGAGHVTLQVLPFRSGEHPSLGGSLTVLTMPDGSRVGYREGAEDGRLLEELEDVMSCTWAYDRLRVLALPPRASLARIRAVLEDEYRVERVPSRSKRRRLAKVQLQQQGGRRLRGGGRRPPRGGAGA
ncbi:DNA-binding protein [Wenjunlia vitaminophila]|uniref:DNA-binding protein n=2 Tax=Wenjunlia vitaminophila TaxID=76728 RepID=A0A0T6LMN2_WENVI|nr:DNA-binding protein [Wenjunlia vitaminophila]